VIYTGDQPGIQAVSCVFSGSSRVRKLIDKNEVDLRRFLDTCTTAIKCVVNHLIVAFANL
jgi:hypothetical protein